MSFPSDLEIARAGKLAPLTDIAAQMGIGPHLLEQHGDELAKIRLEAIDELSDRPKAKYVVEEISKLAGQFGNARIIIEGHTDSTGSDSYNQALSERRAHAVRMALLDSGISSNRIAARGYGKSFPVASNDTAEHRQLNRRVEIICKKSQSCLQRG